MKIYNKVVLDMKGQVVEEDSFDYEGEVALCNGGSNGASVEYAEYLEDTHCRLLTGATTGTYGSMAISPYTNMMAYLNLHGTAVGGNPYVDATRPSNAQAYADYADRIAAVQAKVDELYGDIDALAPATTWESYIDTIVAKLADTDVLPPIDIIDDLATALSGAVTAAEDVLDSTPISDVVNAFEAKQLLRFNRSSGQWASGMATANAVNSSSFVIGAALRQAEFEKETNAFEANVKLEVFRGVMSESVRAHLQAVLSRTARRDMLLTTSAQELLAIMNLKVKGREGVIQHTKVLEAMTIDTANETQNYNLNLDVKEAKWDFELLKEASAAIGNISGSAIIPDQPNKWQGAISGAASGAGIGMQVAGPPGAGVGAVVGAVAGYNL